MITTRQHLNETALSLSKFLGLIIGLTDDQIDEIVDNAEAERLANATYDMYVYTEAAKNA